jgi:hypothetical protein
MGDVDYILVKGQDGTETITKATKVLMTIDG